MADEETSLRSELSHVLKAMGLQSFEFENKEQIIACVEEKFIVDLLEVTLTANRKIKSISIDESLLEDKEQLEDYLILVLNKAIERATNVNEAELAAVSKDGMPNIPGMDLFK